MRYVILIAAIAAAILATRAYYRREIVRYNAALRYERRGRDSMRQIVLSA